MKLMLTVLVVGIMLGGCAHSIALYKADPRERGVEGVKVEVLDSYSDRGIFAVELKIVNESGKTIELDESEAVLVLSTGESVPPYVADETRSAFTRDVVYRNYLQWLGQNPNKRKALVGGSLHDGSWRSGALVFLIGPDVGSCKLMLAKLIAGVEIEAIDLVFEGKVKVENLNEDKSRLFRRRR